MSLLITGKSSIYILVVTGQPLITWPSQTDHMTCWWRVVAAPLGLPTVTAQEVNPLDDIRPGPMKWWIHRVPAHQHTGNSWHSRVLPQWLTQTKQKNKIESLCFFTLNSQSIDLWDFASQCSQIFVQFCNGPHRQSPHYRVLRLMYSLPWTPYSPVYGKLPWQSPPGVVCQALQSSHLQSCPLCSFLPSPVPQVDLHVQKTTNSAKYQATAALETHQGTSILSKEYQWMSLLMSSIK